LEFTNPALQALAEMKKPDRRFVLDGIRMHLIDNNPTEITRNKFPLRRPSPHAERELRLGNWRVFYSVIEDELVLVNLIGEKRGNKLVIGGEDFEL
jgi:mRNA-degrading endonuclease RelE of RelBE toxin-antitoxin system